MRDFELPGRSVACAENGMAATSHPLATLAALDVLRAGGNAVDAAVAAVAVQCVVEPAMTGIGGDCFVLLAPAAGGVVALNGSGRAPAAATVERLGEIGVRELDGTAHSITVPGAVDAWARLLERHGTRDLAELLQPAIRCAEDGFVVTPRVAWDWARDGERLRQSGGGRAIYLPDDRAPVAGQKMRLPALARTLRTDRRRRARTPSTGASWPSAWPLISGARADCTRRTTSPPRRASSSRRSGPATAGSRCTSARPTGRA